LRALLDLGSARARNVLRWCCDIRGVAVPGAARMHELLRQIGGARPDAAVAVPVAGHAFRVYRGRVHLEPARGAPDAALREPWNGEGALPLVELGGILKFKPEEGRGLSVAKLRGSPVTVRVRHGGERLRPDCRRPRRTLKNLLQERGVPPWRREHLPLVYCGEELVSVPGIGDDCAYQADLGEPGLIVSWEPFD
jgi:tRNA(Ile)-lysidine synthase